jgi:glycosyltransferase involved in cell wall biosynthesis
VEYLHELQAHAEQIGVSQHVVFRTSIHNAERVAIIRRATAVLYTPDNEHFGIVPIEVPCCEHFDAALTCARRQAMYCGTPVIAVASGGPLETIAHNETGFLCDSTPASFADAMACLVQDKELRRRMGRAGQARVEERFMLDAFGKTLNELIKQAEQKDGHARAQRFANNILGIVAFILVLYIACCGCVLTALLRQT